MFNLRLYELTAFYISSHPLFPTCKVHLLIISQKGWCDSRGTLQDIKAKIQMKQEGAFKRERALAYALAQKVHNRFDESFCTYRQL